MFEKQRATTILNNTELDTEVSESDRDFLINNVFSRHPFWSNKTKGRKIVSVMVGKAPEHNTRCFYLIRDDGTSTDIGISRCFKKSYDEIALACREAVRPVIGDFRANLKYPLVCPITGKTLNDPSEVHIDHYDLTFSELVKVWAKGKDSEELQLEAPGDNKSSVRFSNIYTVYDFIRFHGTYTHLRAVSKEANLSILRKKK